MKNTLSISSPFLVEVEEIVLEIELNEEMSKISTWACIRNIIFITQNVFSELI